MFSSFGGSFRLGKRPGVVGVGSAGNASYFNGDIGEIVMFTRTLNTSDILNTEAYLKYHWAL